MVGPCRQHRTTQPHPTPERSKCKYIYTFGINVFDVELSPHLIIYLISISDSLTSVKFHVHIIIDQIKKNTNITQQIELSDALKYVEVYKLDSCKPKN